MTSWCHHYSEPLLWLACVAIVAVLSCVPRCVQAQEIDNVTVDGAYIYWNTRPDGKIRRARLDELPTGRVNISTGTSVTTDFAWTALPGVVEIGASAPYDHVHPISIGSGGGEWTASVPRPWTEAEILVTCFSSSGLVLALSGFLLSVRRRHCLGKPLRMWRCRLCGETASGTDVADACVAHILAGACNGDMEDEPLPVEVIGAVTKVGRLQS
jgi:hypothetical protein